MINVGDLVDEFTVVDEQGRSWSLSAHRGRVVLLIFHRHLM